jgi:hypothetical protein
VNRADILELHYIAPIENLPSILEHGILSNRRAARLTHVSVAMKEIQDRRQDKKIPGARPLHDYANLYFDAHNPMLSKRRDQNDGICVLRIDPAILDVSGVIVADRNAASGYVRFYPAADGIRALDREMVYARFWINAADPFDEMIRKSVKCAEALVPDKLEPQFVIGAHVANERALGAFQALNIPLPVAINNGMFF